MTILLSKDLEVELAVLCEDVREEVGRKVSLMGVFSGNVVVQSFPAKVRAAFYFVLMSKVVGVQKIDVRLLVEDKAEPSMNGKTEINFEQANRTGNIIVPLGILTFEKQGRFKVQMRANGGEWVDVLNKEAIGEDS